MTNLDNIVNNIHTKKVYIQTHNFPDPDAFACAYGLKKLLETRGFEATICYKGNVERTVAAKMLKLLNIEAVEYQEANELDEEDEIILVDAQKGNSNIIDMNGQEIICIDHHPIYEKIEYLYSDIRPDIGACASIIASYYYENDVEITKDVATALLYGIKMDTANMQRGVSQLDLDMFYKLFMLADADILKELDNSVMHYEDLGAYNCAFTSIDRYDDICFASAGSNCQEALIASICDFVLSMEGVNLAIVCSAKDKGIKLSIRSNSKYSAEAAVVGALKGIGSGGGHANMAGGFVPYDEKEKITPEYVAYLQHQVKVRFLEVAGK